MLNYFLGGEFRAYQARDRSYAGPNMKFLGVEYAEKAGWSADQIEALRATDEKDLAQDGEPERLLGQANGAQRRCHGAGMAALPEALDRAIKRHKSIPPSISSAGRALRHDRRTRYLIIAAPPLAAAGTATGWFTGWFLVIWIGVVVLPLLIISAFSFFSMRQYQIVYIPTLDTWNSLVETGRCGGCAAHDPLCDIRNIP